MFHNEVWFSFLINTGNCNHWPFFHPLSDDQMIYILVVGESVQGLTIRGGSQVYQSVDKQFRLTRFSTSFHNINTHLHERKLQEILLARNLAKGLIFLWSSLAPIALAVSSLSGRLIIWNFSTTGMLGSCLYECVIVVKCDNCVS